MQVIIENTWCWFSISLGVMLITTLIMGILSNNFVTHDVVERRFSVMDLQFPANIKELRHIINGIFHLEDSEKSKKALQSLRSHLLVDFLFMPAVYGSIFLLCMKVASKMQSDVGRDFFVAMAWAQAISWLLDMFENLYLFANLRVHEKDEPAGIYKLYELCQYFKWGLSLLAAMCSVFAILYFWLTNRFSQASLIYAPVIIGEVIVFYVLAAIAEKQHQKKVAAEAALYLQQAQPTKTLV